MANQAIFKELSNKDKYKDFSSLAEAINSLHYNKTFNINGVFSVLVPTNFIEELKSFSSRSDVELFFGATLRELKCVVTDGNSRLHMCFVYHVGPDKLKISSTSLPYSHFQSLEYRTLDEIVNVFANYVDSLSNYFLQLEGIDRVCCVMEPTKPTFKDDYRRILLDDRVWLHVEVTKDGAATNIHLIGPLPVWENRLQTGLPKWDHDIDIVENIMSIFELEDFPQKLSQTSQTKENEELEVECGICLCSEVPGTSMGLPQPLCANLKCGVFYHRDCLYEWLVASAGGRVPNFGIATGECPNCLKSISCTK